MKNGEKFNDTLRNACRRWFGKTPREIKRLPRELMNRHFYPRYSLDTLLGRLREMGMTPGRTVLVHSSWSELSNLDAKPTELVRGLLELVGPQGTLLMPAFPIAAALEQKFFDVKRTPSGAGLVSEVFRRFPGVIRSVNLDHSVCAIGPNADRLLVDHVRSEYSCDENSPYFRIKEVDGLVVGIGVGHDLKVSTPLHCADSILRREIPFFDRVYEAPVDYEFVAADDSRGKARIWLRRAKLDTKPVARAMDRKLLKESRLSNVELYAIDARHLIDRSIELARKGVTMFVEPRA